MDKIHDLTMLYLEKNLTDRYKPPQTMEMYITVYKELKAKYDELKPESAGVVQID